MNLTYQQKKVSNVLSSRQVVFIQISNISLRIYVLYQNVIHNHIDRLMHSIGIYKMMIFNLLNKPTIENNKHVQIRRIVFDDDWIIQLNITNQTMTINNRLIIQLRHYDEVIKIHIMKFIQKYNFALFIFRTQFSLFRFNGKYKRRWISRRWNITID